MITHYWTCSKFADWLRGTASPGALTAKGWKQWRAEAEARHPFRYWLADEGLDILQKIVYFVPDKLHALKYYINNRWITRTHALTASANDIPRGEWRDVGYRFLPCLFNELRDFVEVELAWWHIAWEPKEVRAKYDPPFWATGWFRWRTWRCAQAGLDNLEWQMKLTNEEFLDEDKKHLAEPTLQAKNAKEIYELYKWWTEEYPRRPDPMDAGGWSDYCEQIRQSGRDFLDFEDRTPEQETQSKTALDLTHKIEEQYDKEDEEMMIRLIKVRHALWT